MKSYICPCCEEKQDKVIDWKTASLAHQYDFKTREWEETDHVDGEHENWACPSCGEEITDLSLIAKIEAQFGF